MLVDLIHAYRKEHGAFEMEDVTEWILANGLLPEPTIDPKKALTRKLKLAARRKRFRDAQGRSVRELVAAKIERVDSRGNKMIDVVWDHLHEMSLSHALMVFSQREEIIDKQCRAATRDVESSIENNPNLAGRESQFVFSFMREAPAEQVVEELAETPIIPRDMADYQPYDDANPITKKKGR
jgi:hypothetical protein